MKIDNYGQHIYSEEDVCDMLMSEPERCVSNIIVERQINIDDTLELFQKPEFVLYKQSDLTIEEFDNKNQANWYMPKEYYDLDIAAWVLVQCDNDAELQRAGSELLLYHNRGMFDLLRYMKYLVDTMRKNNIIWGVGRGSSVSSFVLYLIGVHKINSLYFDLSIDEFLK